MPRTYYSNLFSPETYQAFCESDQSTSGFRITQRGMAARVQPGDIFICYVTRVSRWVGLLEVTSKHFEENSPIFVPENDPFSLRYKVKPLVWLPLDKAIPIHVPELWERLSFTRHEERGSSRWTGQVRNSLRTFVSEDGEILQSMLTEQSTLLRDYPLSDADKRALKRQVVRTGDGVVEVSVPESDSVEESENLTTESTNEVRESIQIQALLGRIGAAMKMKIWIPANDRSRVLAEWPEGSDVLLETLPLNYDEVTIKTIERIDVLWLKGRAIQRAFEVEHTTSVYSGILRMADLLALQPNMDIKLHIVAPVERAQKVFDEIRRPVFSLLERKPLAQVCTFIGYDALRELAGEKRLEFMSDEVLGEIEEEAER